MSKDIPDTQTPNKPTAQSDKAKVNKLQQPNKPSDTLEAEIASEVAHGQLTDKELNSGNDI